MKDSVDCNFGLVVDCKTGVNLVLYNKPLIMIVKKIKNIFVSLTEENKI